MLETDGPGGAEVVVLNMGHELRDRGHTVYPVGPADGWLSERFRESGFEPQHFSLRRTLDWRAVRELDRLMRRLEIDVVHSHEFTMAVYGTAACKIAGRPHVITMHGNQTMTHALRRRVALRWAFRNSHATATVSMDTKLQLDRDLGIDTDVIRLIRNGVPVPQGDPEPVREELGVRKGEVLILAVGNLDARKGHIYLLEALHRLADKGIGPWRLAIAGGRGGPEKGRLEAFAAEHGMEDRFHILSYRNDIPNLLAAADIMAMPSLWEGLPLAILEAMLAGTAIVASEASGIPEAIVSGEHGLLTPAADSEALADALDKLVRDEAYRGRLAAQAKERALKEFTIGAMTDAYEELYRAAVD